jgi:hypothetical protein
MPWEITYSTDQHIVFAKAVGRMTVSEILLNGVQAVQLLQLYKCGQTLLDIQEAEINLSTIEIYYLPEVYERIQLSPAYRVAVLLSNTLPRNKRASMQFLEDVSVNRGYNIHIFYDRAAALAWLNGQS